MVDATPKAATEASAPEVEAPPECQPLVGPATTQVRLVGQGSHADARSDLVLTFETRRLEGSDFRLVDSTPERVEVDEVVSAEEVSAFRSGLEEICVARAAATGAVGGPPGGYSAFEIRDGQGDGLWVSLGTLPPNAKGSLAKVDREQWTRLIELWPEAAFRREAK